MPPVPPDMIPTLDEAAEIRAFWAAHYQEFLARYPNEYVAVRDGDVVAASESLAELEGALRDRRLDPRRDVWIEYIDTDPGSLIL